MSTPTEFRTEPAVEEFLLPPLASQENIDGLAADPSSSSAQDTSSTGPPVSPKSIAMGVASAFNIVRKVSQRVSTKKQGKHKKKWACLLQADDGLIFFHDGGFERAPYWEDY